MPKKIEKSKPSYRKIVRTYTLVAALEGVLALLYLVFLPSDPETRVILGFSIQRWVLILVILLGILVFSILYFRSNRHQSWADQLGGILLGKPGTIPALFAGLVTAVILFLCWLLLFQPKVFELFRPAYATRLLPLFVWAGLLLLQVWAAWFWVWVKPSTRIPPRFLEAVMLFVLFFASFLPRAVLTGYGLPYQSVWDEVVTYAQSLRMLTVPGLKPYAVVPGYGRNSYGDLPVYITTGAEIAGLLNGFRTQQVQSIDDYVSPPAGVSSVYESVHESGLPLQFPRLAFAFLNSLAPLAIFWIIWRCFSINSWFAFSAALIYAVFSREVLYYSSFILPDALAATLFLFLLVCAFVLIEDERGRILPIFLSGIFTGMILATNIRQVLVVLIPFLAWLLRKKQNRPLAAFVSIFLGLFAGFFLSSPYSLIDLPNTLIKWTSFAWYHELGFTHRVESLSYYFQGMFKSGFSSTYVDSSTGSIGLGLLAGIFGALGFGRMLVRKPRFTILVSVFTVLYLYMISPIVQRYTRHALVLYPLVCVFAGAGLSLVYEGLQRVLLSLSVRRKIDIPLSWHKMMPVIIALAFILAYSNQLYLTYRYLVRSANYKPVQVLAAEYLAGSLEPADKVGILDLLPWVESDLRQKGIQFTRIALTDSLETLESQGITYVVGTDRVGASYGTADGTIWSGETFQSADKLAEFGNAPLLYAGYPVTNLYLFISTLP